MISDRVVMLLVAIMVSGFIAGAYVEFFVKPEFQEAKLDIKANSVRENVNLVSGFPSGHVEMDLGSPYRFNFEGDSFRVSNGDRTVSREVEADLGQRSFSSEIICLRKQSGVEVVAGEC